MPKLTLNGLSVALRADKVLLEQIEEAGFDVPVACRNGACGVCRAKITRGEVHYAHGTVPRGLSEAEYAEGFCLPCRAFSEKDITLIWPQLVKKGLNKVQKISCNVLSVSPLSSDTHCVILQAHNESRLPFLAGQYLHLIMPDGSPRAFSIASAPEAQHIELHIRAIPAHTGAQEVIEHFSRRQVVTIEMPLGQCVLPDNKHPLLMIAGGTGFAPMKSLIESALAQHQSRELWLYWGAADKQSLYWHDALIALAKSTPQLHYVPVVAQADAQWYGATGFPHVIAANDHSDLSQFEIFCSGSEGMARAVYAFMQGHGVAEHRFHSDWIYLLREQGVM